MKDFKIIFAIFSGLALFLACSAPEPKKIETKTKAAVPATDECVEPDESTDTADTADADGTDDAADAGTDAAADGADDSTAEADAGTDDDAAALNLLQDTTWEKDIKALVASNCATSGCHAAGGTSPTLETFDQNVTNASASLAEIEADEMPVGNPWDQPNKDLFKAWIDGGTLEGEAAAADDAGAADADGTADEATDGAEDGAEDGAAEEENPECNDTTTTPSDTGTDGPNEEAVTACHDTGWLYDRNTKECSSTLKVATGYTCDRDNIISNFASHSLDATDILNESVGETDEDTGDGYIIDQCGEDSQGKPVVILIKIMAPPEEPGIKIRELAVE